MKEGSTGNVIFRLEWPPHPRWESIPFYKIRFQSRDQPFWDYDKTVENGFKSLGQRERFHISDRRETSLSLAVNLTINDACIRRRRCLCTDTYCLV